MRASDHPSRERFLYATAAGDCNACKRAALAWEIRERFGTATASAAATATARGKSAHCKVAAFYPAGHRRDHDFANLSLPQPPHGRICECLADSNGKLANISRCMRRCREKNYYVRKIIIKLLFNFVALEYICLHMIRTTKDYIAQ